jgi:organic radical activating enzyme
VTEPEFNPVTLERTRDWLLVSETFVTIQGEGPSTGERALFIRLGGCNQHCKWCDTGYTWAYDERHAAMHESGIQYDPQEELRRVTLFEMVKVVLDADCRLVVITGGEPMLQSGVLASLISAINGYPHITIRWEIETAGTVSPFHLEVFDNVSFNVSPKLEHSGNELELRRNIPILLRFSTLPRVVFKFVLDPAFVVACTEEIELLQRLAKIPDHRVWIMPLGTSAATIIDRQRAIADQVIAHRWNLSTRLHTLIWGDERGR